MFDKSRMKFPHLFVSAGWHSRPQSRRRGPASCPHMRPAAGRKDPPRRVQEGPRPWWRVSTWSDTDFLAAVQAGGFSAEPWHPQDLTPNGLDLRISHVLIPLASPEPVTSGVAKVPPLTRFVVGTEAYLKMPREAI